MLLYIIRHAYAYEHGDPRWPDDSQRPLEPNGAERFRQVVSTLSQRDFTPELIATSPYARCRQTADIVAAEVAGSPEIVELPALTPGSDLEALIEWSQALPFASIAWVGHSPDVNHLAAEMIGSGDAHLRFPKGAVAAIRLDRGFVAGSGQLCWLITAKMLGV